MNWITPTTNSSITIPHNRPSYMFIPYNHVLKPSTSSNRTKNAFSIFKERYPRWRNAEAAELKNDSENDNSIRKLSIYPMTKKYFIKRAAAGNANFRVITTTISHKLWPFHTYAQGRSSPILLPIYKRIYSFLYVLIEESNHVSKTSLTFSTLLVSRQLYS